MGRVPFPSDRRIRGRHVPTNLALYAVVARNTPFTDHPHGSMLDAICYLLAIESGLRSDASTEDIYLAFRCRYDNEADWYRHGPYGEAFYIRFSSGGSGGDTLHIVTHKHVVGNGNIQGHYFAIAYTGFISGPLSVEDVDGDGFMELIYTSGANSPDYKEVYLDFILSRGVFVEIESNSN